MVNHAFGAPGIPPRWTWSAKDGVGCAYSTASRIWFTLSHGILNEVYYPTVDRPQLRDCELVVTDGETFVHEEKRDLDHERSRLSDHALGYRLVNADPRGRYRLEKELIAHPHQAAILMRVRLVCDDPALRAKLRVFALVASHLDGGGRDDVAWLETVAGKDLLLARDKTFLALGASVPFAKRSVGYVGHSDGWSDLVRHRDLAWSFDEAGPGNVAMCGELALPPDGEFTLALAFGESKHHAVNVLFTVLSLPWAPTRARFLEQWERAAKNVLPLEHATHDEGHLYRRSRALLLAHEDKSYPGAFIASLSIPWGEAKGDDDSGGYHLVWTRDLCNSATALLACGDKTTPLRSLIYLACAQQPDGGFFQNFWIDGTPYWHGVQLDEVAFPILLARRLHHEGALAEFDPYPMVLQAARFLVAHGPATAQERWEENSGYSPSTLAAHIAALVCAGAFARERGDVETAALLERYADFLEQHVDKWTVTWSGTLHPEVKRHYVRIAPTASDDPRDLVGPEGELEVKNQAPGARTRWPASEVVDAGFLELVRYGIRKAGDPLMENSLKVVDAVLLSETPHGPVWRRYNHDGYGQREDGGPFVGHGKGRPWPLLTGERGHYELAAGRDASRFVKALEGFSASTGMLPEQVWDEPEAPGLGMPGEPFTLGGPTGAAMPLMWAHAEYVKLVRSVADGRVYDRFDEVAARYADARAGTDATATEGASPEGASPERRAGPLRRPAVADRSPARIEVWKFNRRAAHVHAGGELVVIAEAPFTLRMTTDGWATARDVPSRATPLGLHHADVAIASTQEAPLAFTFYWPEANRWEGENFEVAIHAG